LPYPADCGRRRVTLSNGGGALKESGDLAQFLAEFLFCRLQSLSPNCGGFDSAPFDVNRRIETALRIPDSFFVSPGRYLAVSVPVAASFCWLDAVFSVFVVSVTASASGSEVLPPRAPAKLIVRVTGMVFAVPATATVPKAAPILTVAPGAVTTLNDNTCEVDAASAASPE
jgi:hypothetical protein